MFLFSSSPVSSSTPAENPLARPLQQAARESGVPFDYLVKTAQRESNLNPNAQAPNSSASGLFQFIEQTWLGLVKRSGAQVGLEGAAEAISQDRNGRYVVQDAGAKQQILALRKDPTFSARMAGVFTAENRESLKGALGRDPSGGELYIAHFMGAGGARELISQATNNPGASAARLFPDAASSNRSIFFDGKGKARSVREVYARLVSFHQGETPPLAPTAAVAVAAAPVEGEVTRSPLAMAPARSAPVAPGQARAFNGFFRSGGNGQGAAELRKTWVGVAQNRVNAQAPSFFPRADSGSGVQVASLEAVPPGVLAKFEAQAPYEASPTYAASDLPAPPQRPAGLGQQAARRTNGPLDLIRFLRPKR